ncbi:MAG: hypothetical protein OXF41_21735 [bacterium]|nr:hypothetical protein [bacterium]
MQFDGRPEKIKGPRRRRWWSGYGACSSTGLSRLRSFVAGTNAAKDRAIATLVDEGRLHLEQSTGKANVYTRREKALI